MSEFKHTTDEGEEIIFPEGKPASRATPAEELRAQVMDVNVPKSEREWWARYVITELEQELELTKKLSDGFSSALIALEQENERLREAAQKRADCGHDDECGGRVGNTCGCGHTELEAALENNNE